MSLVYPIYFTDKIFIWISYESKSFFWIILPIQCYTYINLGGGVTFVNSIILFDGECNFCNSSVQFIIKRDKKARFRFSSLQSDIGQKLLTNLQIPADLDSIILVESDAWFAQSTATLRICRHLNGGWKLFSLLQLVPKPLRDAVYKLAAKNRYRWFGKKDACMLPSPEIRKRFLS